MAYQCPHCLSSIDMEGKAPREFVCPSCGSSIQLDPGATTAWLPEEAPKRLGKFEILEQLGVGTFGAVYKARDTELHRTVALKVPRSGNIPKQEDQDRFLREARSAAQLKHPGIVALYDAIQCDGTCCLVAEFISGATLAERLSAKRFSFRQAAMLIAEVAEAMHYAHQHGVIHRDMKPSNIMLDLEGRPHVMDFGLAKRAADEITMTLEGQVLGTPAYMSPEQARGEMRQVDARSDIYGLGVILYELLTSELPFRGQTRMLLVQVMHDEPRPPRRLNDKIPRDLETICLKAMAKEPGRRYTTARELAEDLRRFLGGEPIRARPISAWERAWRWTKRRPAVAATLLVSAVAVVATVAAGVGWTYNARLEESFQRTEQARREAEEQRERAQAALVKAEFHQYFHHVSRAHAEWRDGHVGRVQQLLDECPTHRRDWEWHYLRLLCRLDLLTLTGHTNMLFSIAFSPDGRYLASSSRDQTVRIWDATSGRAIHVLQGHTGSVVRVVFSPDGKHVASAAADGTAKIWHAASGQLIQTLEGNTSSVRCVAYSPDGTWLAMSAGDNTIRVCDATTTQTIRVLRGHTGDIWQAVFSPDGTRLASAAYDKTVRIWDAATGAELFVLQGHTANVRGVAFSPDGTRLASTGFDNAVKIWDASTGLEIFTLQGSSSHVWSVCFSPDGFQLATSSVDQTVRVRDALSGRLIRTLKGHTSEVEGVAFSPDQSRLASGSFDNTLKVWDAATEQEARTLHGHTGAVRDVAISSGGDRLVSAGSDQMLKIWDTATGQELLAMKGHTGAVTSVAFSPDGSQVLSAGDDKSVKRWNATTGAELPINQPPNGELVDVAFGIGGAPLAITMSDQVVTIWNLMSGQAMHELRGHTDLVSSVVFSPDRARLASASFDFTVKIWDTATSREIFTLKGHTARLRKVAFSADGKKLASASNDNTVKVWDVSTGQLIHTLEGHTAALYDVAFNPRGTRLVSGASDQNVKIWDALTGQEAITLKGHTDDVIRVAFSPDGERLVSASYDGTIKVWDARPWTPAAALEREALGLLEFLFAKPLRKVDVIDYLQTSPTVHPQAKQLAVSLIDRYREESDAAKFHQASRVVIRLPYLNTFQYWFALKQAEAACQLTPERRDYVVTLGGAQYRAGAYQQALTTLTNAEQLNRDSPAGLAFVALAHHRLGQREQALATLSRLRELTKQPEWANDEADAPQFLREAETLIGVGSMQPAN